MLGKIDINPPKKNKKEVVEEPVVTAKEKQKPEENKIEIPKEAPKKKDVEPDPIIKDEVVTIRAEVKETIRTNCVRENRTSKGKGKNKDSA